MAWHDEPSNDSKDKKENDVWNRARQKNGAPPDLEAALRQLKKQLAAFFSSKETLKKAYPRQNTSNSPESPMRNKKHMLITFCFIILFIIWTVAGIFIVAPAEQAVILRFGQYKETVGPGPHWIPLFIDKAIVRDVDKVSNYSYSAKMLTKDENIVSVSIAIQYRIGNLKDYLFNAADPQESLQQATASALRQVVGHSTLNEIIAEGREVWGRNMETLLNRILSRYQVGIVITSVSPQPARAPQEVQDAFDDAINAQEDEKRFKEQAYAYTASVVPIAEGKAKRIITAALAYEKQAILHAEGETSEFLNLLPEYLRAPQLMKERMYLETMERVLQSTTKVILDDKHTKNFLALPLDVLIRASKASKETSSINESVQPPTYLQQPETLDVERSDIRTGGRG